ncbi:hypothetical protein [Halarcobacter sp.]|uniref:hypothetical protein n=1 Tax=Halarcobacter sp. TaxID=2321133 RepID=UPI002AAB5BDA|nr:hypothetical protein [Halarcobacter sp.]
MGICLDKIKEGCCKDLKSLNPIDLDSYKKDKRMSSVDNVLECSDKFIFIEEKSFILDFFRLSAKRMKIRFKPEDNIISDEFLDNISHLEKEEKKELFYKSIADKTLSLSEKIKDTTMILCKDDAFCDEKIKKTSTIYLYCKSGLEIDKLFSITFNSKKQREKIIECTDLKKYLIQQGCGNK